MKDAAFYPGLPRKFTRLAAAKIRLVVMRVELEECIEIAVGHCTGVPWRVRGRVIDKEFSVSGHGAQNQYGPQGIAQHGKFHSQESHAT